MRTEIARAHTPDGDELLLRRCGDFLEIRCNGWELMSNRAHHSEAQLATLTCTGLTPVAPRVLIGGLGLGYTLRAALDCLPPDADVTVAELLSAVIDWHNGPVGQLADFPLRDPRVRIISGDVAALLHPQSFDVILLDVDNGPDAIILARNAPLYGTDGLRRLRTALRPGGILGVWSADPAPGFAQRLTATGFSVQTQQIPARGQPEDPHHTLYLARVTATQARVTTASVITGGA